MSNNYKIELLAPVPDRPYPWVDGFDTAFAFAFTSETSRRLSPGQFLLVLGINREKPGAVSPDSVRLVMETYNRSSSDVREFIEGAQVAAPIVLEEVGALDV